MVCLGEKAQVHALKHADRLRGFCRVEVDATGRGAKAQMKGANLRRARYVLIAGEDEVSAGTFQLKDLNDGEQREVGAADLDAAIREGLGL